MSVVSPVGVALLRDAYRNRGLSFTAEQRRALRLQGLLPARVMTLSKRCELLVRNLAALGGGALDKYRMLREVQNVDEDLFFFALLTHTELLMPLVYTPTVGDACIHFSSIFVAPRGLYVTANDAGRVRALLDNWPEPRVSVIVFTDGERILGLGDRGANGMGIPIGKLALYTALAGVPPQETLPVTIDVGCDRPELRNDPYYIGLPQPRLRGPAYDALIDEFIRAAVDKWPSVLLQFEDFGINNAIPLLERYRSRVCCFNDDIQGTGSVTLAGLLGAARFRQQKLSDLRILFLGAGSAAVGIADTIVGAMVEEGADRAAAMARNWFIDTKGLVCSVRTDLADYKKPYAHAFDRNLTSLVDIVRAVRPNCLVGVSGIANQFTQPVIEAMLEIDPRPVVFALSNPTSNCECTADDAYRWSKGRAIFASGSPFQPVDYEGQVFVPGQANNAYIFPGVGLGAIVCGARHITDEMFVKAARVLSNLATADDFASGCLFPSLKRIREVSLDIAEATCQIATSAGLNRIAAPVDGNWRTLLQRYIYVPEDGLALAAL